MMQTMSLVEYEAYLKKKPLEHMTAEEKVMSYLMDRDEALELRIEELEEKLEEMEKKIGG